MKKTVSSILAILMILAAFSAAPVYAAADDDPGDGTLSTLDSVNRSLDLVPDDHFDGDYDEFDSKDGSKTRVFKNGSVVTEYKDGTKEGFDYKGNHHYIDKDDNATVMIKDGAVWTEYADGRNSVTLPGGNDTVVIDPDHSFSVSSKLTGIVREYDSEGDCTGVGFVGSDERLGIDEYGDLLDGKISGPDGASLEIKDGGAEKHLVTPDGKKIDYTQTGIADSADGRTESYTVTYPDGKKTLFDVTTKIDRDKSTGESVGRTIESSGGVYYADGEKIEFEEKIILDKNGEPIRSANNVAQWTGSDGKTLWIDKNSGAFKYNDPVTGAKVVIDAAGNMTEYKSDKMDFKVEYDPDGSIKTAYYKTEGGAEIVLDNDWGKVTLPNGDVYEVDESGTIKKNGEIVKMDGEWVNVSSDSGNNDKKGDTKTADAKHWVGTYDTVMTQGGLPDETGKSYWLYVKQDETTGQLKVTTPQSTYMTDYDPGTLTARGVYTIDGVDCPITVVFSEAKGVRHMKFTFEWIGVRTEIYEGDEVNGKK